MTTLEQRIEELLLQLTLKEKVALLSGLDIWRTVPIERAGHSVDHDDGRPARRAREPARSGAACPARPRLFPPACRWPRRGIPS